MKKHTSEEAYYERLRNLAQSNKTSVKESRTLGTLIDYKRAADGVAYGIIKEQHRYFVKKAGIKPDPNVADFAYIGGLANITDFQYKSLSEADKQRNMMFHTINEAVTSKPSKTGSKKRLNEDKASQEIDNAENKLGDLDAATASAEVPAEMPAPEGGAEMAAGLDAMPAPEAGAEMPPPEAGADGVDAEVAPEGGDAVPEAGVDPEADPTADAEGGEVAPEGGEEGKDEATKEIEKTLGKLANTLRKTELEPSQVKSYVNTYLAAFKDKFPDIDIEDRKAMAEKITKVVPPEDIEDLGQNVEDTEGAGVPEPEMAEGECSECGTFAKYAESRGYNADSIRECGEEEVGNLVSGYANAHNDGQNDGDLDGVALVVKIVNPEILNSLRSDYGHEDYANKLEPVVNGMNESSEEDNIAKLNELFGGLRNLGKAASQAIGGGLKSAGQAIGNKVSEGAQAVAGAAKDVYKAGAGGQANLSKFRTAEGTDPANVETQPNLEVQPIEEIKVAQKAGKKLSATAPVKPITEEEEVEGEEIESDEIAIKDDAGEAAEEKTDNFFSPESQSLGVGTIKPDGAPTTGVDITISPDKEVNISMNESEKKLRKYIRNRLEEKAGLRKPVLTESKKSATLKKLDGVIDKQFQLYESVMLKKQK